jgi:hypothetical protein
MPEPSLTEFLLARIADDEAVANGAASNSSAVYPTYPEDLASVRNPRVQDHFARWQPARILAECEANRRVIELHTPYRVQTRNDGLNWNYQRCATCTEPEDLAVDESYWPCKTIQALALPYNDHPDFRDEWRP